VTAREPRESRARRTRAGRLPREVRAVDPGSWNQAAITTALRDSAALVGRAPRAHEWSSTGNGPGLGAARWLAEHPRWPSAGTVVYHFGSWSDALHAAGLPTLTVEHELPRRERVATAIALRAAGESMRSIAEQLGAHPRTVHRYLAAHYGKFRRYDAFLNSWWHHTPQAELGEPPLVVFVCQDHRQREQFMAAADHELTGHRWHPSVDADRHEYVGRRRVLFALERDMHAGALEAWRLPAFPHGHPSRIPDVRHVRLPGDHTSAKRPLPLPGPPSRGKPALAIAD
jgi:hypothetical protein